MAKFIYMRQFKNDTNIYTYESDDLKNLIKYGKDDFEHLSFNEKNKLKNCFVLESVNPDEEEVNHFDGNTVFNFIDLAEYTNALLLFYSVQGLNLASIDHDYKNGYLTINTNRNKQEVIYYQDGNKEATYRISDAHFLTPEEIKTELN